MCGRVELSVLAGRARRARVHKSAEARGGTQPSDKPAGSSSGRENSLEFQEKLQVQGNHHSDADRQGTVVIFPFRSALLYVT